MNIFTNYNSPGKHNFIVQGEIGALEVELFIPNDPQYNYCAILGHPHSLHGGTMQNKVVTTTAAAFTNLKIPTIKFNFRGVGDSFGTYDAGIGESLDMLFISKLWQELYPSAKLIFAGFSFGSFVAYRASCMYREISQVSVPLITIAPSVNNYDYKEFAYSSDPWLVIHGEDDEIVAPIDVYNFVESFNPPLKIWRFPHTTHFFHGKLVELKERLTVYLTNMLPAL